MTDRNLILVVGQEGAGKSTTVRELAPTLPHSARIDAEDLAYVNPWSMDEAFLHLLWKNVSDLTRNFWAAGYRNVVAGSFLSNVDHYNVVRDVLNTPANVYLIQLCASKHARDLRRIERPESTTKSTTKEWRDHVDQVDPEDTTLAAIGRDFRYLRIDNGGIDVSESVERVRQWAPELFRED